MKVTVAGFTYDSTVASMGGEYRIALSKANREAAGVNAGDEVMVTLELDETPRSVELPDDLKAALKKAALMDDFEKLSASKRKAHALSVADAKTDETRQKRIQKVLDSLQDA